LTKTAALEFAQRAIRINAVCPRFVRTPAGRSLPRQGAFSEEQILAAEPMHRIGKPYEIAEAVAMAVFGCVLVRDGAADAG
jgi:NAD(P)-dependent dehydrogenase (short-subunit alcohol dehydrogenase family)